MMLGFSGYLIFGKHLFHGFGPLANMLCYSGLIIGLSYDKITKIIPLFVIL